MNVETDTPAEPAKKPPRKPRPSELRAKAEREAAKRKPKAKKKPNAKTRYELKRAKKAAKGKTKAPARKVVRSARLDLRCTPSERALAIGVAKRKGVTVTDLVMDVLKRFKVPKGTKRK